MYDDYEYASSRLLNTIIRDSRGVPFLVDNISPKLKVEGHAIGSDYDESVSEQLKDCDCSSPPLGYVNSRKTAAYVARKPMRRDWRQGLRKSNMVNYCGGSSALGDYRAIGDTIMNVFPSFEESLKTLSSSKVLGVAFHRHFAINIPNESKDFLLLSKFGKRIGDVNSENGAFTLTTQFGYLHEYLQEVIHGHS